MSGIVRQSKFRHVFGKGAKRENCYENFHVSNNAWDSNYVTVNLKYFGLCWQSAGGGSFVVIPWEKYGKLENDYPLFAGHKNAVLDLQFNPFNDNVIASVSEDGSGKIWVVPEELKENQTEPAQNLKGHSRQVGTVRWNPTANNILCTSSKDYTVKVWDAETGADKLSTTGFSNIIQSTEWNYDGSLILTTSKDKKARIVDPRERKIVSEVEAHTGIKGLRGIWLGNTGRFLTVGFSRNSDRQYAIWDPSKLDKPVANSNIDTSSGMLMPFYDADTKLLFLAGKGDGNIRYYEVSENADEIFYINNYVSNVPQTGMELMPKFALNINECEIVRCLKLTKNSLEPISFFVPRRGAEDNFQADIFPDTAAGEATVNSAEWFGGKSAPPKLISLEGGFKASDRSQGSFTVTTKNEEDEGPQSEAELRKEYKRLKDRVAYLEAELVKKDAIIASHKG